MRSRSRALQFNLILSLSKGEDVAPNRADRSQYSSTNFRAGTLALSPFTSGIASPVLLLLAKPDGTAPDNDRAKLPSATSRTRERHARATPSPVPLLSPGARTPYTALCPVSAAGRPRHRALLQSTREFTSPALTDRFCRRKRDFAELPF